MLSVNQPITLPKSSTIRGFTCGSFDLLHAGHILLLKYAKSKCNHLIVGLQVDPSVDRPNKNKPVQSLYERQLQLEACKYVDQIIVYETEADLELICKTVDFDVRFLGEEYKNQNFTGKKSLLKKNPHFNFEYVDRSHGFSSTELRWRIKGSTDNSLNYNPNNLNIINLTGNHAQPVINPFDLTTLSTQSITSLTTDQINLWDHSKIQTFNFDSPRI